MRQYSVPVTIEGEEKIIGGVLTFKSFGWCMLGGVIGVAIFIALSPISWILGLIVGCIFGLSGIPFAFLKPKGYTLVQYLKYKRKFKKKNKKMINK